MDSEGSVCLTIWELSGVCKSMKDLKTLYQDIETDEQTAPLDICQSTEEP